MYLNEHAKMTKLAAILFLLSLSLLSCSRTMPAGFWSDFDKNDQIKEFSNQGPWGGHRALLWRSETQGSFDNKRIIEFATKNGWTFIDSSIYSAADLKTWTFFEKQIFPLSHEGFNPRMTQLIKTYEYFPRRTKSDVCVLQFKTGWVSILPGTDESNEINGFVMITKDQKEMSVYHLWGE